MGRLPARAGPKRGGAADPLQRGPPAQAGGNARERQAAKRAIFPKINQAIIAAAERDLPATIAVVEPLIPQMNVVNLATALHRLARVSSSNPESLNFLRNHPVVPRLLAATQAAFHKMVVSGANPKCQALSNVTWAMATVEVVDVPLLCRVASMALPTMTSFKVFELSGMLWGFAKLSSLDPQVRAVAAPVFMQAVGFISEDFSFRCLLMTAWAYATMGHHEASLFKYFGDRMLVDVHSASGSELVSIAWAFRTAGAQHTALLSEVERCALQRIHEFGPTELVHVLSATASRPAQPLEEPAGLPLQSPPRQTSPASSSSSPRQSSNAPSESGAVGIAVVEDCFAGTVDAAAAAEFRQCAEAAAAVATKSGRPDPLAKPQRFVCTVKNTFLDVGEDGTSSDEEELQSPLDFIPADVIDPDKLAAYRASYQKFRSGQAVGAKGEMCSWVTKENSVMEEDEAASDTNPSSQRQSSKPASERAAGIQVVEDCFAGTEDAAATAEFRQCTEAAAAAAASAAAKSGRPGALAIPQHYVCTVKNTFLDVDDDCAPASDEEILSPLKELGPSLDFIPAGVIDPDKLAAYRASYQKFRAGQAVGAKGEMCNWVTKESGDAALPA